MFVHGFAETEIYCTAKANSQGCVPQIGSAGTPSVTSPSPFSVSATEVLNQKPGVLFYGFGPVAAPFLGGVLCVQPPLRRNAVQLSGGNPPPDDCSGSYAFAFNALIQSGTDPLLIAGAAVHAQFWSRDPADAFGVGLTDAIAFEIEP